METDINEKLQKRVVEKLYAKSFSTQQASNILHTVVTDWEYIVANAKTYSFVLSPDPVVAALAVLDSAFEVASPLDLTLTEKEIYLPRKMWVNETYKKITVGEHTRIVGDKKTVWRILYTYGSALYKNAQQDTSYTREIVDYVRAFCSRSFDLANEEIELLIDLENGYAAKLGLVEREVFDEVIAYWRARNIEIVDNENFKTDGVHAVEVAAEYIISVIPDDLDIEVEAVKAVTGLAQWGFMYLKRQVDEVFFPDCEVVGGELPAYLNK